MRLYIKKEAEDWVCAEVFCQTSFGYGLYRFTVDSRWEDFPDPAVLGLFTWSHRPEYHNREIDIEVSHWGGVNPGLGQFTVQPHSLEGNNHRFQMPKEGEVVLSFQWAPEEVSFSASGSGKAAAWSYRVEIPPPGSEKVHINLWLYQGAAPDKGISVLVKDFSFTPLSSLGEEMKNMTGGVE